MGFLTPPEVADRYFECVRSRDIEGLMALYAEDAEVTFPDGRAVAGTAAIRDLHQGTFAKSAPMPNPGAKIIGQTGVAVEIQSRLADGVSRRTANFFHLNESGRIKRLSVYWQGS